MVKKILLVILACCLISACGKEGQEPPFKDGGAGTEAHAATPETPKKGEEAAAATPLPEVPDENPQKADASFLSLNKTEKVVFGLIQATEIFLIGYLSIKLFKVNRFPRKNVLTCLNYSHAYISNLVSWVNYFRDYVKFLVNSPQQAEMLRNNPFFVNCVDALLDCLIVTKCKQYMPILPTNDEDGRWCKEVNEAYLTQEDNKLIDPKDYGFAPMST